MDLPQFYSDHKKFFLTLFVKFRKEAVMKLMEVECESFFLPCLAMCLILAIPYMNLYIHDNWVVKEYPRRCKNGARTKKNMNDELKCWNLERMVEAELLDKQVPEPWGFDDFLHNTMTQDGKI
ncbi:hypothetical protein ACHAWF_017984 [Thalassiosira exigua]